MLKNIIIMIIAVQASYFAYNLILEIGSTLTSGIMEMINPQFFSATSSSGANCCGLINMST